jgi:hypothetical protein
MPAANVDQQPPSNLVYLLKNILHNLRTAPNNDNNNDLWSEEKGAAPSNQVFVAKKSLGESAEQQDETVAVRGDGDAVRTSRSENRFLQIQGLDNHLAHMSRPR